MPGSKTDHSSLSTDEVKNEWILTTTSPVCYLDVHRDKVYLLSFTFDVVASCFVCVVSYPRIGLDALRCNSVLCSPLEMYEYSSLLPISWELVKPVCQC